MKDGSNRHSATHASLLNEMNALLVRHEYDQAFECVDKLLRISPGSWAVQHCAGLCCFGLAQFSEAMVFFEKAQKIDYNRYATLAAMASCYVHLGRLGDAFFYRKLCLTVEPEVDGQYLPPMLEFQRNLDLWQEDKQVLIATENIARGLYQSAQKNLLNAALSKDPSVVTLTLLLSLSLKIGAYADALHWAAVFHSVWSEVPQSRFSSAQVLLATGHTESAMQPLQDCLHSEDQRIRVGAVGLLANSGQLSSDHLAQSIQDCWQQPQNLAICLEGFQHAKMQVNVKDFSLGILIGDLSFHSPARWLLPALNYFSDSSVHCTLYIEKADYWARQYFHLLGVDIVESEQIDAETLCCIFFRNDHHAILDLSGFNESTRLDVLKNFQSTRTIGFAEYAAHLKDANRAGYDGLITTQELDDNRCYAFSGLSFLPELAGRRWSLQQGDEFCIVLAMMPADIPVMLPLLIALIQLNSRIQLSINETLCGEEGLNRLIAGFEQAQLTELLDRVSLYTQQNFRNSEDIAEHLLCGDVYISTGVTGYDHTALAHSMPMVMSPILAQTAVYTHAMLLQMDNAHVVPATAADLVDAVEDWVIDRDKWSDWVMDFQQCCLAQSLPAEHFTRLQKLIHILFAKG